MSEAAGSATKLLYFCLLPAVNMFAVPELKILLSHEQIAKRVAEMGAEISRDFAGQPGGEIRARGIGLVSSAVARAWKWHGQDAHKLTYRA